MQPTPARLSCTEYELDPLRTAVSGSAGVLRTPRCLSALFFLVLGWQTSTVLGAAGPPDWSLCRGDDRPLPAIPEDPALDLEGTTVLTADEAQAVSRDTVSLKGRVEAVSEEQLLQADTAVYRRQEDLLRAEGNVLYRKEGLVVEGDAGEMKLSDDTGWLGNARFRLYERHARGKADMATFEDRTTTSLERMTYTTCDPGNEDWLLRSSRVRLDQETGIGTARNVSVSFMGIPFLYAPYLTFPIDDRRKSGFLPPTVRDSSTNGLDISVPYYFNLAPRFDATLTPRHISRRGNMLESEFRYLNPRSSGLIAYDYLPDDDLTGEDRSLLHYRHSGRPAPRLTTDIQYNHASDAEYFRDLGGSLSVASIMHLNQHALVNYGAETWTASARLQNYQTIDNTIPQASRPYRQLPVVAFRTLRPETNFRPHHQIEGGYVNFDHRTRLNGHRVDLQPSAAWPMYAMAGFLRPTIALRHTAYDLEREDQARPVRTLPMFSLDSGIFLERDTRWGAQPMLQTLEPRLFYLYVPRRDQSDLPIFDTGLPDFNFTQLFRMNRFNGADRVGDANQLSVALTTRFLESDTGRQRLQAGIGRVFYFQDREVTLGGPPETVNVSDIVAEATANLTQSITVRMDARWSEEAERIDMGGARLQYMPAPNRIFNISYRSREPDLKQTDVSLLWPLGRRWHLIGRHNYSLHDERVLETLAGLEYQSCCWNLRVVGRRHIENEFGDYNRSLFIQFELKGLTSIGDRLETLLEHGILGYRQ